MDRCYAITDTTDLIQRLRFLTRWQSTITHADLKEAADALEAQVSEIAEQAMAIGDYELTLTARDAQIAALRADAERYSRLCDLVAIGEWSIGRHEVKDSYGCTDDFYMDDKAHADKELDATIASGKVVKP